MDTFFKDKVFLVTGASSGIGKAVAECLSGLGCNLVIMARTKKKLAELQKELGGSKRTVVSAGDVSKEADCKKAVSAAIAEFSQLDGIIHSAGITMRALAEETKVSVYKQIMETNFYSLLYLFKHGIKHIKEQKGHFVAISSVQGKFSTQIRSGYAASKHAVQGFMDSIRLEVIRDGVHAMTVSPGYVRTDISINAMTADGSAHNLMDKAQENGLPPEKVAREIARGIVKGKRDIFPSGFRERFALYLSQKAPSLLDRILLKAAVN